MEVLETIQNRRTVRVPFSDKKVSTRDLNTLLEVSQLSPSGDSISWRLVPVEDSKTKEELAKIVRDEFGVTIQKSNQRFREIYSQYPKWLRFSKQATDGIVLLGFPKIAKHVYGFALGRKFGPLFGRLGIMNSEIDSYCKNIISNPLLFGVFINKHTKAGSDGIKPIINTGSMLQNLRLTATSLGLSYQDLGWITATKNTAQRARQLLGLPDDYIAVNFFRVGYADTSNRESKKSDIRRDLKDIIYIGKFGNGNLMDAHPVRTNIDLLDAVKGKKVNRDNRPVSNDELGYILEAARWAPTGFNVQPFEFVVVEQNMNSTIVVLENKERKDPDPGPCESLARGGVLQNIRLASRALGLGCDTEQPVKSDVENIKGKLSIPQNYSVVGLVELRGDKNG